LNIVSTKTNPYLVMTVLQSDYEKYGCPYCGYTHSETKFKHRGAEYLRCISCKRSFLTFASKDTQSPVGFHLHIGDKDYYPEVQEHPRPREKYPWLRRRS